MMSLRRFGHVVVHWTGDATMRKAAGCVSAVTSRSHRIMH